MLANDASRYGLEMPSEDRALRAFARVLGETDALRIWTRAKEEVGLNGEASLTLPELRRVAERLAGGEGFIGIMGTSLRIRLDTYEALASSDPRVNDTDV